MPLSAGTRLGAYEIGSALGAGGMGEVYRARDAKLNRDVALKVLPELFACDPDRLARFKREAQVLASLNHPNIAAIYGLEESNGVQALVLELVEGPTLADRVAQGPIPPDEALPMARQIAAALEAAHEQGIIHRDLKPANIKVRPDGAVKVLDFGLAKALEPVEVGRGDVTASPTITSPALTQIGMILGTAAYLSPEQVKGRPADKRSDVWAFGAVLYEMLSGQRAFKGEDISDTLAAVLRQTIDVTELPASTPAAVRRLVSRCLERDVKRRLRDIGEARIALEDPTRPAREDVEGMVAPTPPRPVWRRAIPVLLSAIVAGTLTGTAVWYVSHQSLSQPQVARFLFPLPEGQAFVGATPRPVIALSPDGAQIAYAANTQLFLRSMSGLDVHAIPGTEHDQGVSDPVFSPDGRSILFYAYDDHTIKRIAVTGGPSVTICRADPPYGISWGPDGIVFGQGTKGIMRVSAESGTPTLLVRVKNGEEASGPQLLPGGHHVLFTLASGNDPDRWDKARIVIQPVTSGEPTTLIEGGSDARYVPTGHLVYAADGTLFAVAFDVQRLKVSGGRSPVVENVRWSGGRTTGASHFSISSTGSLIYIPGFPGSSRQNWEIALTDRQGEVDRLNLPPGRYGFPRVSPDGTRIAFGVDDGQEANIYTYDLSGASTMQRLTSGGNTRFPVWASDSKRVAFQSDREGDLAIWQSAVGGTAERLTKPAPGESHAPESWHPKADLLLFSITKGSDVSLWTFSLQDRKASPFGDVHSFYPTGARFSPDGRWIAYTSREPGEKMTIYVQPFPATGDKFPLFVKGSNPSTHKVAWSPDGKELYYVPRLGEFEAVTITTQPRFAFGNAVRVPRPFQPGGPNMRTWYDVTPSGKFLGLIPPGQADALTRVNSEIQVVLNWFEELNARVPPAK
jgi:eukaryotic-like serine/threonine-protein kinase